MNRKWVSQDKFLEYRYKKSGADPMVCVCELGDGEGGVYFYFSTSHKSGYYHNHAFRSSNRSPLSLYYRNAPFIKYSIRHWKWILLSKSLKP